MDNRKLGQVITFYSYKGGTGRSMSLANVACLLARQKNRVLIIDWDLEAPGLHRYFQNRMNRKFRDLTTREAGINAYLGLIDLFGELDALTKHFDPTTEPDQAVIDKTLNEIKFEKYLLQTDIPNLVLLKSGRFDEKYSAHVSGFPWDKLYERVPWLFKALAHYFANQYDYVLIDSRTGISDTSGICTAIMPEKLVLVFTPNRQSLVGILDLVETATSYRRESDDLRPLVIFPLPSRVEQSEGKKREIWKLGGTDEGQKVKGFQPEFEDTLKKIYRLPECNLQTYFDEVQIQHAPRFSYGEEIAVEVEESTDSLSLTRAYRNFTERLIKLTGPWEVLGARQLQESSDKGVELSSAIEDKSLTPNARETTPPANAQTGKPAQQIKPNTIPSSETFYPPQVSQEQPNRKVSKKRNLFINYARVDKNQVEEIVQVLREGGYETWLDQSLIAGQSWQQQLQKQIDQSDALIYVLTPNSVSSEWCFWEYSQAVKLSKPIIPVLLRDCEPPSELKTIQYVDFRSPTTRSVANLLRSVEESEVILQPGEVSKPIANTDPSFNAPPVAQHSNTRLWVTVISIMAILLLVSLLINNNFNLASEQMTLTLDTTEVAFLTLNAPTTTPTQEGSTEPPTATPTEIPTLSTCPVSSTLGFVTGTPQANTATVNSSNALFLGGPDFIYPILCQAAFRSSYSVIARAGSDQNFFTLSISGMDRMRGYHRKWLISIPQMRNLILLRQYPRHLSRFVEISYVKLEKIVKPALQTVLWLLDRND